uniref:Uncharacterized protein n=1 Tax=Arundo donax TaxID=35708 RepID=A0A0A8ZZI7_ARUDO
MAKCCLFSDGVTLRSTF